MSLPDPRRLPEYYTMIQMPISIDTMEVRSLVRRTGLICEED